MMNMTVFGIGAAGNKAAISLIENNILDAQHIKLLKTTVKDIPDEYVNDPMALVVVVRNHPREDLQSLQINFAELLNEDSKEVILVSSVEGGTGSGSVPVVAKYFDAMNIPVHVFAFIGFQDEARGINNTLKFFKDLPSSVVLHTICNSYFLDYTNNYGKAERAANEEFANQIEILRGSKLIPSKHNIDDTDLYKINTQPGYMTINHIPLAGIKNTEGFNAAISAAFENACHMDNDLSAKRIAVMVNASSKVQDAIDNSFEVVKRYVGVPIETFQHIQPDNDLDMNDEEYIDIVACGMNYPERPIKDVNNKYLKVKEKLNTSRKSFDDIFGSIDMDDDLDEFNVDIKNMIDPSKADSLFLDDVKLEAKIDIPKPSINNNKKVNKDPIDDYDSIDTTTRVDVVETVINNPFDKKN